MMARIRKSMDEKDKGFTLIELLVVVIIIGILAAIAIPVFMNQRKKAVDASIKSDLRTVATALETYYTDNQAYASAAQTGTSLTIGTGATAQTVKLSPDNDITVSVPADGSYCLFGKNAKGSGGSTDGFTYKSAGGLANTAAAASGC